MATPADMSGAQSTVKQQIAELMDRYRIPLDAPADEYPAGAALEWDQIAGTENRKCALLRELIAERDNTPGKDT